MTSLIAKPLYWTRGAKDELLGLPAPVVRNFGYALSAIQLGGVPHTSLKPLHGFAEPVLELRDNDAAGTYRVVFCAAFGNDLYVLHCFQKKSTSGSNIPRKTVALIEQRLKEARRHHERPRT